MADERLQKILSNAGIASRREAEEWMLAGRISVNGNPATELGARADPDTDEILVDGVPIDRRRYRYFALNKPVGVLTAARDDRGRATVVDMVPIGDIVLHPVGRLDLDSEGLILLTNDGHLTDLLTHPRNEVDKEYLVGIDKPLSKADIQRMVRGIDDKGEHLRATSAQVVTPPATDDEELAGLSWVIVTLRQGKNREIRRMMEALGKSVKLLRRTRIASLHIGNLGSGSFRELEDAEISTLYRAALAVQKQAAAKAEAEALAAANRPATISKIGPARPPREQRPAKGGTFAPRPPRPAGPRPSSPQGGRASSNHPGDARPGGGPDFRDQRPPARPGQGAPGGFGGPSRVAPPAGPTARRQGAPGDRPAAPRSDRAGGGPRQERSAFGGPRQERPGGPGPRQERSGFGGPRQERPGGPGPRQDRSAFGGPRQERPGGAGPRQERPGGPGPRQDRPGGASPRQDRPAGAGPRQDRPGGAGPRPDRPGTGGAPSNRSGPPRRPPAARRPANGSHRSSGGKPGGPPKRGR